ncbi:MAG: acyl-CoA dehydrogenase family protein [Candidatus Symbiobacter sp.]|nr:acyl-CoA dehydrogenase family protein [Candidatus Symbiobacter sp.]
MPLTSTLIYPLSDTSLAWQKKGRTYADQMQKLEVYAEAHGGEIPPEQEKLSKEASHNFGFSRLDVPVAHGGLALSIFDQMIVWEQLGRVTNGLVWSFAEPQQWMFENCSPAQLENWIRPMMLGTKREAFALTETDSGSSADSIKATARRDGDHYVLNGEKWYVTSANHAQFYFFEAVMSDDPNLGHGLLFVDVDTPGITALENPLFMHTFSHHHPTLRFSDVRVPVGNLIGKPGGALDFTRRWFRRERIMIAARCCGAATRLLEEGLEFAQNRLVDGSPISEFQMIQAMLADCATDLWAARLMTYQAAQLQDQAGIDSSLMHAHASMAKLVASEMVGRVADKVLQIFGGRGYRRDNVAERFFREVRVDRLWEGTSEIQRLIIARALSKRGVTGLLGGL